MQLLAADAMRLGHAGHEPIDDVVHSILVVSFLLDLSLAAQQRSFDLSKCLFIFSYNDENLVNPILKDRMYRIQTKGYDSKEKTVIAKNYLLPKIQEQVNFKESDIIVPDDTIQYIISTQGFTKNEDGVRNLKRCLEIIYTKLNLFRLVKPENNIFSKKIDIKVEFPFTVLRKHADILLKNDENQNQSLLAMYV